MAGKEKGREKRGRRREREKRRGEEEEISTTGTLIVPILLLPVNFSYHLGGFSLFSSERQ